MSRDWTRSDVAGTLRQLDWWWDLLGEGVPNELLDTAPAAGEASFADVRDASIQRLTGAERAQLDDLGAVMDEVLADLSAAGRVLARLGVGPGHMDGTVAGIHRSDGGVPKLPVGAATVGYRGVDGDRQGDRRHHGRVWQALCLWSTEVIEALRAEGHPIAPGNTGENLTLSGLDWQALRPGTRLRVGGALAELTLPAPPCAKNAGWFRDGDFMRMDPDRHPGWNRWYAMVLQPGEVAVADPAVVEPDGDQAPLATPRS